MVELGFSRSLSEWIGNNLKRSGDSEIWAFNLDGAVQMFNSYRFCLSYEPMTRRIIQFPPSRLYFIHMTSHFPHCRETSYWSLLENPPKETEINFVIAEKSDRWDNDTTKRLETVANQRQNVSEGKVATHLLRNSGHWVHTDNPKGLLDIMSPNFLSPHK